MGLPFKPAMLRAYFVCGSQDVPTGQLPLILKQALAAGITAFQYRDKAQSQLTPAQRVALGQQLRQQCAEAGVPFIVDDDVDLALALHADGVHVGQTDLAADQVLKMVQQELFVGLSCETLAQVKAANQIPSLAYYGCGAVYPTSSKDDVEKVLGLNGLRELIQATTRPVVAIGGIKATELAPIKQTGAAGVAVISMISQSPAIHQTVQSILQAFPKVGE